MNVIEEMFAGLVGAAQAQREAQYQEALAAVPVPAQLFLAAAKTNAEMVVLHTALVGEADELVAEVVRLTAQAARAEAERDLMKLNKELALARAADMQQSLHQAKSESRALYHETSIARQQRDAWERSASAQGAEVNRLLGVNAVLNGQIASQMREIADLQAQVRAAGVVQPD